MFFFISLINIQTLGDNILITLSLLVNFVGIVALAPVFMKKDWAYKAMMGWVVIYIGFLVYNVFNAWLVNTTGYMMLLLALLIIFISREKNF
jgi:hypothetical protein